MRKSIYYFMGCSLFVLLACNNSGNTDTSADSTVVDTTISGVTDAVTNRRAHADISSTKADTTGNASADFSSIDENHVQLKLTVSFPKMANKSVAVHLHEHGDCGDSGAGAHGHWNPTKEKHGKWGSGAYHSGDIGNVTLDEKGNGEVTLESDRWSIGGDEKTNILNKAVIVHSGVDDYTSQPSGNAGSRIGCGVINEVK